MAYGFVHRLNTRPAADPPPDSTAGLLQFSSPTYSVSEDGVTAEITVTRSNGTTGAVGVSYATSDGTATAGTDYTTATGTLSWADGDSLSKTFNVPVTADALLEGDETVNLTLSLPTGGAEIGTQGTAILTIIDVIGSRGTLQFSSPTYSVNEDGIFATITVTRTGGSTGAVGVTYATYDGSAVEGIDYVGAFGTLAWADGNSTQKQFIVPVNDDAEIEGSETVNLILTLPTGGAVIGAQSQAILTIIDTTQNFAQDLLARSPLYWNFNDATSPVTQGAEQSLGLTNISGFVDAGSGSGLRGGITHAVSKSPGGFAGSGGVDICQTDDDGVHGINFSWWTWVYFDSVSTSGSDRYMWTKRNPVQWAIVLNNGNLKLESGAGMINIGSVSAGQWNLVFGTVDADGLMKGCIYTGPGTVLVEDTVPNAAIGSGSGSDSMFGYGGDPFNPVPGKLQFAGFIRNGDPLDLDLMGYLWNDGEGKTYQEIVADSLL